MKRSTIETVVLIVGVIIIAIALFFMFGDSSADPSRSLFITNLTFAFGFLIYIIYSIMSTNSLNKEIRGLNKHIEGLKHEITKYKKQIADKDSEIQKQQQELSEKDEALNSQLEKITALEKKLADIESSQAD